jgi:predicted MFS family arabinose efflux permease
VLQERRASEPLVPPRLFHHAVFDVAGITMFLVAFALFGAIVYLPLFLQVVHGVSPTSSGLRLLPLMGGVLTSSILTGRAISKLGRYKPFPVAGAVLMTLGLYLLSRLAVSTGALYLSVAAATLGLGLGMVMPVMLLAVQNAVEARDLGAATSSVTFMRSMGGAFGVAVFGAIFANRLGHWLPRLVPGGGRGLGGARIVHASPAVLKRLPAPVHAGIVEAFSRSLHAVFLWAIPFGVVAFLATLALRELPLRERRHEPQAAPPVPAAEVR